MDPLGALAKLATSSTNTRKDGKADGLHETEHVNNDKGSERCQETLFATHSASPQTGVGQGQGGVNVPQSHHPHNNVNPHGRVGAAHHHCPHGPVGPNHGSHGHWGNPTPPSSSYWRTQKQHCHQFSSYPPGQQFSTTQLHSHSHQYYHHTGPATVSTQIPVSSSIPMSIPMGAISVNSAAPPNDHVRPPPPQHHYPMSHSHRSIPHTLNPPHPPPSSHSHASHPHTYVTLIDGPPPYSSIMAASASSNCARQKLNSEEQSQQQQESKQPHPQPHQQLNLSTQSQSSSKAIPLNSPTTARAQPSPPRKSPYVFDQDQGNQHQSPRNGLPHNDTSCMIKVQVSRSNVPLQQHPQVPGQVQSQPQGPPPIQRHSSVGGHAPHLTNASGNAICSNSVNGVALSHHGPAPHNNHIQHNTNNGHYHGPSGDHQESYRGGINVANPATGVNVPPSSTPYYTHHTHVQQLPSTSPSQIITIYHDKKMHHEQQYTNSPKFMNANSNNVSHPSVPSQQQQQHPAADHQYFHPPPQVHKIVNSNESATLFHSSPITHHPLSPVTSTSQKENLLKSTTSSTTVPAGNTTIVYTAHNHHPTPSHNNLMQHPPAHHYHFPQHSHSQPPYSYHPQHLHAGSYPHPQHHHPHSHPIERHHVENCVQSRLHPSANTNIVISSESPNSEQTKNLTNSSMSQGIPKTSTPKRQNSSQVSNSSPPLSTSPANKDVATPLTPAKTVTTPLSPASNCVSTPKLKQIGKSSSAYTPTNTNGKKRRASMGKWTEAEDELLRQTVQEHDGKNWKSIAERLPGRTDVQCLHRWQKVLKPGLVKGPWTKEEDETVIHLVGKHGQKQWSFIAKQLQGRLGKQCRERWYNHLNPGRTDNAIKNRWNSTLQRILKQGRNVPTRSKRKSSSMTSSNMKTISNIISQNQKSSNHPPTKIQKSSPNSTPCTSQPLAMNGDLQKDSPVAIPPKEEQEKHKVLSSSKSEKLTTKTEPLVIRKDLPRQVSIENDVISEVSAPSSTSNAVGSGKNNHVGVKDEEHDSSLSLAAQALSGLAVLMPKKETDETLISSEEGVSKYVDSSSKPEITSSSTVQPHHVMYSSDSSLVRYPSSNFDVKKECTKIIENCSEKNGGNCVVSIGSQSPTNTMVASPPRRSVSSTSSLTIEDSVEVKENATYTSCQPDHNYDSGSDLNNRIDANAISSATMRDADLLLVFNRCAAKT